MREHSFALSRRSFIGGAAVLSAATCTLSMYPTLAFAEPTAAEKQAEAAAALDSLNAMQTQLDAASNDYFHALEAQDAARQKVEEAQARIDEASAQISDLQDKLGTRARSMYRSGSLTFIDLLLGATSFQAFTTNWDLLNDMNQDDADMVQETKDLRAEVEQKKAEAAEQERIAAEQAQAAADVKAEAEQLVSQMQATYDSLSAEAAALLEEERIAREAAEAAANEQEKNNGGNAGGGGSDGGSTGGGGGNNAGDSIPPTVSGNIVVDRAYSQLGKPYIWAACGPEGYDCSGLVSYCLTGGHYRLGSTGTFINWPRVSNPQPGDVCVIHNSSNQHTGIYIGGGSMIHAATYGVGVIIGPVQAGMVYVRY